MKARLIKKIDEARGTKTFCWEVDKKINFLPGQYLYFTLPKLNYADPRGATRHFTVSSSPTEKMICLTTRIREESGYKKTLDELKVGSSVEIEGPTGTFVFDEKAIKEEGDTTSHVFLAGGVGITPFRSFIKYNIDKKLNTPMYLIYSNSDSEFIFGDDLKKWQKENSNLKTEFFDSSKLGHLDGTKIRLITEKWKIKPKKCLFWLVGPPVFVSAIEDALDEMGLSSNNLITEKFTGY